jgi:hypothetical protein
MENAIFTVCQKRPLELIGGKLPFITNETVRRQYLTHGVDIKRLIDCADI